jgi:hypothetical protein
MENLGGFGTLYQKNVVERILGVILPNTYQKSIGQQQSATIGGHKILGYSLTNKPDNSALGATILLRSSRPDLPPSYLAICIEEDRVLCLDLAHGNAEDAPLVDVPLDANEKIIPATDSFKKFVEMHQAFEIDFGREMRRLRNRKGEFENKSERVLSRLDRKDGKTPTLSARPQEWHPRTIRAHDFVIALTAFKYNQYLEALEVDAFYAFDDPRYEPGDPIRALVIALFGEALHYGGKLDLAFTRDEREGPDGAIPNRLQKQHGSRHSCPLPSNLVQFAEARNITFSRAEEGMILHKEGIALWWNLLKLTPKVKAKAYLLEEAGYLSKEHLAMVISAGIWSPEQAPWILLNAPRPEAILLGSDRSERCPLFAESLEYGRAAILAARFARQVSLGISDGIDPEEKFVAECTLEPKVHAWKFRCSQQFTLPWLHNSDSSVEIKEGETITLLIRPTIPTQRERDMAWLASQVEILNTTANNENHRCLLLSMEFGELDWIGEIADQLRKAGVHLLFAPRRLDLYEEDAANRLARARRLRQFPERIAPLKLQVLEVPEGVWQSHGMRTVASQAETMSRWIAKRVDVSRARREITINCRAIERIALQSDQCVKVAELDGEESILFLAALERTAHGHTTTFPFVRPEWMGDFHGKLKWDLRKKIKLAGPRSGIVVVHQPYEHSAVAISIATLNVPLVDVLPTDVPLDPFDETTSVVGRSTESLRLNTQIEECLRKGEPLAVSYVRHETLAEVLRHHLYWGMRDIATTTSRKKMRLDTLWCWIRWLFGFPLYRTEKKTKKETVRNPKEPIGLRMTYSDGTEGVPFPCYSLKPSEQPSSKKFYQLKVGLVSMRHRAVDGMVARYLMRNAEMQTQCGNSAEQEQFAFERTLDFIEKMLTVLRGKELNASQKNDVHFRILVGLLGLDAVRAPGLELQIFQTTGLEPAIVGVYRAISTALADTKYRGKLVVVPRILVKGDYCATTPWY